MSQRADAIRNRARLVEASREVFALHAEAASLEEIARRAGVGIGTLYRHFPTREALVEEIYAEHLEEVVAAAEGAAAAEDAWDGLVGFLERVLELQARNLPLRDVFLRHSTAGSRLVERKRVIAPLLQRTIARAQEQGTLRADFTYGDLSLALWSFAPLFDATAAIAPNVWRRHLRIVLDGMRPEAATAQSVRPLAGRKLEAATQALRGHYHGRRAVA